MSRLTIEYLERRIEETYYEQGIKSENLDFGPCRGVFEGGMMAAFKEILLLMKEEKVEAPTQEYSFEMGV